VIRAVAPLRAKLAAAEAKLASYEWPTHDEGDRPLPEDEAVDAAFPTRTGRHDICDEARRLVGAKRSKWALIGLVNWLLVKLTAATASEQAMAGRLARACEALERAQTDALEEAIRLVRARLPERLRVDGEGKRCVDALEAKLASLRSHEEKRT
jgi:hypothetical protein